MTEAISKSERVRLLIKHYSNGKQNAFAEKIKVKPQTIHTWLTRDTFDIEKIYEYCEDISAEWLLTGKGSITKKENQYTTLSRNEMVMLDSDVVFSKNRVNYDESATIENPPIIPSILSRKPGVDLMEIVRNSTEGMEICPIQVNDAAISLWHRVNDDSLLPEYRINDKIALCAYPRAFEKPIPGLLYGIDTYPYGLLIRKLYPNKDGYIARSVNTEEFPDMFLAREEIIRFFRIALQVRVR